MRPNRALRFMVGPAIALIAMYAVHPASLIAQPALDRPREAGPLTVFPDAEVGGRFYYLPGPLELANRNGRPAMLFLLTRYTGSRVTGDQGESQVFAHLSFGVEQEAVRADAIERARRVLAAEGVSRPDLRLLPIRRTEAQVVYAPLSGGEADTLSGGAFESERPSAGTLKERRYTLRLDRYTAEALWKMFESERTLVSFSYAYVASGVIGSGGQIETEGDVGTDATFEGPDALADDAQAAGLRTVRADAFEILVDPEEDADLIRVVDMNADRPLQPNHGVLDIRCYDFRNDLRPDLAMKIVELEGRAANGRVARDMVIFRASAPDEAVHRVRFPFAVRLEAPLRYRIREIATDGEELDLGWQERDWIGVLDVSTPLERLEDTEASSDSSDDQ